MRRDKFEYHVHERFCICVRIRFGYLQVVEQAGFCNGDVPLIMLKDGMLARATYLYADGADLPPRIVKLEIAEEP